MKKTIICVSAKSNRGKSSTIKKLYTMLGGTKTFADGEDIWEVVTYKGHKIGIKSQGDPGTDHRTDLGNFIVKVHVDVVVTASRSTGQTLWSIYDIAKETGFETIVLTPMSTETEYDIYPVENLNTKNAEAILEIINNIINN